MQYEHPTEAFEMLYKKILKDGIEFSNTKAIFNTSFTIKKPEYKVITTKERNFNKDYANFEWQWYLKGDRDASQISEKAKIWKDMIVPGTNEVNSNYGYFWNKNKQLTRTINILKSNKQTRRAILVHYDIDELDRYQYDTPCNNMLNFYILEDKLYLTIFARSIDLVYGFCNDQFTFAKLMEYVAREVDIKIGSMNWMITNLHVYPRHYELMK